MLFGRNSVCDLWARGSAGEIVEMKAGLAALKKAKTERKHEKNGPKRLPGFGGHSGLYAVQRKQADGQSDKAKGRQALILQMQKYLLAHFPGRELSPRLPLS